MKTTVESTNKTPASSTSCVTRERGSASLSCHARRFTTYLSHHNKQNDTGTSSTSGQTVQVERLFPDFFAHYSHKSFPESYKDTTCVNRKLDPRMDEPLIQSWLNLYGGGLQRWY